MGRLARANRVTWDAADAPFLIAGLVVVGVIIAGVTIMLDASALDVWSGLIVFLVLMSASVPLLRWVARKEEDPWLFKVLFGALVLHLAVSLVRYYMIFVMYHKNGDAGVYHGAGLEIARQVRDGRGLQAVGAIENFPIESQRVGYLVGFLYVITGPSAYAGFFVFTYLCYWGQVLVVRAFKVAVPEGDYRRLTLLVMFLPSLLFWPSSIGKEALMIACLGVIVYGGALLLCEHPKLRGGVFFVIGILLVLLFRPHVALMAIGGLGLALAVGMVSGLGGGRQRDRPVSTKGRVFRVVGLVAVLLLASVGSTRLGQTLKENQDGSSEGLEQALTQTAIGNSEFTPAAITGPTKLPAGFVTVLARPFPWEAHNLNNLIAATEGIVLLGLAAMSWRRLMSLPRLAMRRPFLIYCAVYVLLFVVAFSYIANFGILARQRVQVLPVLLVFFALPKSTATLFRIGKVQEDLVAPDASVGSGSDAAGASALPMPNHVS